MSTLGRSSWRSCFLVAAVLAACGGSKSVPKDLSAPAPDDLSVTEPADLAHGSDLAEKVDQGPAVDEGVDAAGSMHSGPCGNGVLDPGEQCDPGMNPPANDGCGAPGTVGECQFTAVSATDDVCPGQSVSIAAGTTILRESDGLSTYGFHDDYQSSCDTYGPAPPNGGRDRVFQVVPALSGTLTVKIGYQVDGVTPSCNQSTQVGPDCWFANLYARTTCTNATTELACALGVDLNNATAIPTQISFAVTASTPYSVFVDGYDGQNYSYGPFNLILTLQ